ncbi:MAG: pyrimidine-nucleoside phosphorylase [Bradymonadia bacterium]|jgi:pyrimidine-nucleoside phosphorylase
MIPELILKKRDGHTLSADEIRTFIGGYTDGSVPDYQAAAMLMAVFFRGMSTEELVVWTDAMLNSGQVLDFSDMPGRKVDKHSTGGVGDKISLILAPLVAAAGVKVPMISGRGLGHTGGTLDKLESIPGFRTDLTVERFRELVSTLNLGLIGQTGEIAPADKKLYALRDVTSTVECIPLIASSIMSKKLAEGIDALVLDVKTGSGAFMARYEDAKAVAQTMVNIGQAAGKDVVALITDMGQPLGEMVGNALEVIESCDVLKGGGPADIRELTLELGAHMVVLAEVAPTVEAARELLVDVLDSGRAMTRFEEIVDAQGGNVDSLHDYSLLPTAPERMLVKASRDGFVTDFACSDIGRAAGLLGAGRSTKEDDVDPRVGLQIHVSRGDRVAAGDPLVTIYHADVAKAQEAAKRLQRAISLGAEAPAKVPLIFEVLGA